MTALLSLINGLAYLLCPGASTRILGISPEAYSLHITRYYGACALGYGILLWQIRAVGSYEISRAILISILVLLGFSVGVGIVGQIEGVTNQFGWLFIGIDLALSLGSLFLIAKGPEAETTT